MTALIRNLATMTRVGVLAPGSAGTAKVVAQLGDAERLRKARVHPIAVLAALRTYAAGHGARGRHSWTPVRGDRRRARRRVLHGVRERRAEPASGCCSRSTCRARWRGGTVAGVPGLTPRDASAALALVTAATETRYETVGFFAGQAAASASGGRPGVPGHTDGLTPLAISPRQRLDDVVRTVSDLPFGGTDCALPMLYALGARAGGRHVRDLHRLRDLGGRRPPGPGARASTAARRASTPAWSWSGWSRTASRSPTRTTRACSTSSASTPRRRS